ncbi:tRNA glutamyl-Q(34) synthetase GluQRS [Planctomycetaceae bacterium SH139]
MVVGRLAPSPTGAQHLGNARTYLLAWLAARSAGGRVILRIEDIDSPRVKPWATQQAIDDLHWLGLDWDEGPDIGGPSTPYLQTERVKSYDTALRQLIDADLVYPCVCSRTDIAAAASAPHAGEEGPLYPGTCAAWQAGHPLPPADQFCWRFRSSAETFEFIDLLRGPQTLSPARQLGDFPVTRKGGQAAYQLAVVVDDAAMEVTQVVRGDDLLLSTFRQLELYRALGLPAPEFAHVPLVVGPDGRRLAKRHGDTRLSWYREQGVTPQAIIGWCAFSSGLLAEQQACTPADLLANFSWSKIPLQPVTPGEQWVS